MRVFRDLLRWKVVLPTTSEEFSTWLIIEDRGHTADVLTDEHSRRKTNKRVYGVELYRGASYLEAGDLVATAEVYRDGDDEVSDLERMAVMAVMPEVERQRMIAASTGDALFEWVRTFA